MVQVIIDAIVEFFMETPILLGFIAAIGLIAQRKSVTEVLRGAFMAAFGMAILLIGVDTLVGSIVPLNDLYAAVADDPDFERGMGEAEYTNQYGSDIGIAMVLGYAIHILIALFTKVKTIFLTGHFIWWMPFVFVAIGVGAGMEGIPLIIWGAVLSAVYWSFMPYFLRPYSRAVLGDDSFTLGHPSAAKALIAGTIARFVGNKEKSTEDLELPKWLGFFREVSVMGAIIIFLMYVVTGLTVGDFAEVGLEGNLVFISVLQGLQFGAGLLILLYGVRLFVNEIVPAFEGISQKIIPGAQPAYDAPLFFTYKPNAVLIGFIVAMITSTALIFITNATGLFFGFALIPLVIPSFFEVGLASVMADGQGGLRGAIIGSFFAAIFMVFILGISLWFYRETIFDWMLIFGGNDMSLWGTITGSIANLFN